MIENGNKRVQMLTPEPTTPDTTNKETGDTHKRNRKGNFGRRNKGGARWLEQNYFKGETTKLNAALGIINGRLDQGVTFEKFQDVLNNYVVNKFRMAEDIVEIITDLNDTVTNFDTKHMPDDLTEKEEESKVEIKIWEIQVK